MMVGVLIIGTILQIAAIARQYDASAVRALAANATQRIGGGNSYGCDVVGSGIPDQTGERRVNQDKAQVIGRVFMLYRDGTIGTF